MQLAAAGIAKQGSGSTQALSRSSLGRHTHLHGVGAMEGLAPRQGEAREAGDPCAGFDTHVSGRQERSGMIAPLGQATISHPSAIAQECKSLGGRRFLLCL